MISRRSKWKPISVLVGLFLIVAPVVLILISTPFPKVAGGLTLLGTILVLWGMHGPISSPLRPLQFRDDDWRE